ncbi:EscU/YscU/HrcU family type III secretion system export apparatus switch protein [Stenotrophomonas sp. PS02300]|uniref:EscU/YscU/HrcU family type III secretion system export apparatus switch protein n=1 Tax=Stenotrophomonas sp. PS02300 TaxID=2991426 RepID=UPI00249AF55B|nr:EscU/YscU/HrcU family type III secretion system export apparatus switch protein [Stenotrophomonas sp. PS02300]
MKTEKPTPHRLLKESKKGKSFVSRDLAGLTVLIAGLVAITTMISSRAVHGFYRGMAERGFSLTPAEAAWQATTAFLWIAVPVGATAIVAAVLISLLQSRGVIAAEAVRIDLARVNPISGFKNLFSLKTIKGLVTAVLYLLAGLVFVVLAWKLFAPALFAQVQMPDKAAGALWHSVGWRSTALLLAVLAPIALAAAFVEYRLYIREMRMEKHEVKQEHKDHNGNPEIKQRRRQIGEELSGQVQADVAGSSMILANPTHIAVGIFTHPDYPGLQFVSVRERGNRARKVIALAEKWGIPVVRDIPVARAVYFRTRRYQFVPGDLVAPISRILAWLKDIERNHAQPPPDSDPVDDSSPDPTPPLDDTPPRPPAG